jgi:hypothetical protein
VQLPELFLNLRRGNLIRNREESARLLAAGIAVAKFTVASAAE